MESARIGTLMPSDAVGSSSFPTSEITNRRRWYTEVSRFADANFASRRTQMEANRRGPWTCFLKCRGHGYARSTQISRAGFYLSFTARVDNVNFGVERFDVSIAGISCGK